MHTRTTSTRRAPAARATVFSSPRRAAAARAAMVLASVAALALSASAAPALGATSRNDASAASQTSPASTAGGPVVAEAAVSVAAVSASASAERSSVAAQPTPPPAPPAEPVPVDVSACGVLDVAGCITEAFTGLLQAAVTDVINPALGLLTQTLLQTPQPSTVPRLDELWSLSWRLAVALYATVVLVGGLVVMAQQSVQTRYGVREIGPRLVVGFVAGWLTLPLADMAVQVANAVSASVIGGVDERAGVAGLAALVRATITAPSVGGGLPGWPLLLASAAVGALLLAVLCGYVLRVLGLIVLVAAGPLVVMWHALPQTDPVARWWWRALAGLLAIQIIQALIISVGLVIVVPPPDTPGSAGAVGAGPGVLGLPVDGSGWVDLLVLGALLWLLLRVPGWVWSSVRLRTGGSSLLGRAVKGVIAYKTWGFVRGGLAARTPAATPRRPGPGAPPGSAGTSAGGGSAGGGDPFRNPSVSANGQFLIPFPGLGTRRRAPARRPATSPTSGSQQRPPRPGDGQLSLPADGLWPEQRAVLGRDGQYRFAFPVTRVPRSPSAPVDRARPTVAGFGGRQLPLDLRAPDPYRGIRPGRSGQYPLPLPGLRRHPAPRRAPGPVPGGTSAPRTGATPTPTGAAAGRQLRLPIQTGPPAHRSAPPPPPAGPVRRPTSAPPPDKAPPPPLPAPSSRMPGPTPARRPRQPRRAPQLPMRKDKP